MQPLSLPSSESTTSVGTWWFPLASKAILNETYIDDIVSGAATEKEALHLQQELISLLKRGGFDLKKWASNNAALLQTLPLQASRSPYTF